VDNITIVEFLQELW